MSVLWVFSILALLLLGLFIYFRLRPGWVARSLEQRVERRGVYATIGVEPFSWRALFVIEVSAVPGCRAKVRAGLARITEESDVVIGLAEALLAAAIGKPGPGDEPFSGTLDDVRRERARAAFADAGLELHRMDLVAALPIDDKLARAARVCIENTQREAASLRCSVLDFYLDGISGLGYWWATHYTAGHSQFGRSTDLVKNPGVLLKLVPGFGGGLVFYRTLGELMEGNDQVEELVGSGSVGETRG